jgi:hypothetical protein
MNEEFLFHRRVPPDWYQTDLQKFIVIFFFYYRLEMRVNLKKN